MQAKKPRNPERSPCIGVCELDETTGWCRGCLRSGNEIAAWPAASLDLRRLILRRIETRREIAEVAAPAATSR